MIFSIQCNLYIWAHFHFFSFLFYLVFSSLRHQTFADLSHLWWTVQYIADHFAVFTQWQTQLYLNEGLNTINAEIFQTQFLSSLFISSLDCISFMYLSFLQFIKKTVGRLQSNYSTGMQSNYTKFQCKNALYKKKFFKFYICQFSYLLNMYICLIPKIKLIIKSVINNKSFNCPRSIV